MDQPNQVRYNQVTFLLRQSLFDFGNTIHLSFWKQFNPIPTYCKKTTKCPFQICDRSCSHTVTKSSLKKNEMIEKCVHFFYFLEIKGGGGVIFKKIIYCQLGLGESHNRNTQNHTHELRTKYTPNIFKY